MVAPPNSPSAHLYQKVVIPRKILQIPPPANEIERVLYPFFTSIFHYFAVRDALTQSLLRYDQAVDANKIAAEIIQAKAVTRYAQQVVEYLREINQQLPAFHQTIKNLELNGKTLRDIDAQDLSKIQSCLLESLPEEYRSWLRKEGLQDHDLMAMQNTTRAQSPGPLFQNITSFFDKFSTSNQVEITRAQQLTEIFRTETQRAKLRSLPEPLSPQAFDCPVCHQPLTWIAQYQRWYCYTCNAYREQGDI